MTKWIQSAVKKPGALRAALKVKKGAKIPEEKLSAAAKKPGKIGQRARLAETLKSFSKGKRMAVGGLSGGTNTNEPAGPGGYGGTGNSGVSGGIRGGGGGQGGPAGGVRTGTVTGTSATNRPSQSEKNAPVKAIGRTAVKPPVVKPPVVAAPKPGLSYRYNNPLSPGYGPGNYWGGASLYGDINAPQDYRTRSAPGKTDRESVNGASQTGPNSSEMKMNSNTAHGYRKGGMAKAKLTREEMKEFKGGKYMGGPAEEKLEKKKGKRMADGGLAGGKAPFVRDNLSPRARLAMGNPAQNNFGRKNPPTNMLPGRGQNRGENYGTGMYPTPPKPIEMVRSDYRTPTGPIPPPPIDMVRSDYRTTEGPTPDPMMVKPVQDYAAPPRLPQISTPLPPAMRGGGIARKGIGQALAKGGLVKGAGCVQRGMKKPRYT